MTSSMRYTPLLTQLPATAMPRKHFTMQSPPLAIWNCRTKWRHLTPGSHISKLSSAASSVEQQRHFDGMKRFGHDKQKSYLYFSVGCKRFFFTIFFRQLFNSLSRAPNLPKITYNRERDGVACCAPSISRIQESPWQYLAAPLASGRKSAPGRRSRPKKRSAKPNANCSRTTPLPPRKRPKTSR